MKVQIPVASRHYAKELMEEVNADRQAHGKKPFDDDDEPPALGKKPRNNTSKKEAGPAEEGKAAHRDPERDRPGQRPVCEGGAQAAVCL